MSPGADISSVPLPGDQREDGYELWLRYRPLANAGLLREYRSAFDALLVEGDSPTLRAARDELVGGLRGLLGEAPRLWERAPTTVSSSERDGLLVLGTPSGSPTVAALGLGGSLAALGGEGFVLLHTQVAGRRATVVASSTDIGVLYGAFALIRHLQLERPLGELPMQSAPRIQRRMLDHWDNLDRTIERGYAGFSIWDWHRLPDYVAPQYTDYARACASVGLNGAVLTNVNANALVLTPQYLRKVAALADVFRPYGVRVYLTARFNAPVELDGLAGADPLDPAVMAWWRRKVTEIYEHIPDFGGFLVKANSEGQPGPRDYGRSHADGANLLADALAPHGGIVIWRAFVYDDKVPDDRAKQAYDEFVPLDGAFRDNVCIQVKNGPIDFQPREPFHPLFGAMPKTPLFLEFQLTQEYLGFATHLVYLGPLIEEVLRSDTYAQGPGSTVARVVDGSSFGHRLTGIAAVANIGTDRNWCGHPFAAANWYAFGRLAWDPDRSAADIADEWLRQTFSKDVRFVEPARELMLASREAVVDYMTPLGLHHLMAWNHHYGPGPWVAEGRPDWTSVYFHRADREGIGFDRTVSGSNAVAQYRSPLRELWGDRTTCPETLLLWFHHVPWQHRMASGRTLWEELCVRYAAGVEAVRGMQRTWVELEPYVDAARFEHVRALLDVQEKEAIWWRDACVLYFQTFSKMPLPSGYETPAHDLDFYLRVKHFHVPGI